MSRPRVPMLAAATLALATVTAAAGASGPDVEVIARGLNNPRGLGFAPNGDLYVAEAGSGGDGACRPSPDGRPQQVCYGETGALTQIDTDGKQPPWRVLKGLPSMAAPGGFAASSGPVDVDFQASTGFVVIGWGGDPALRSGLGPRSSLFGTLLVMMPSGLSFAISDIASTAQRHGTTGEPVDSDPSSVLALRNRRIVADAGANALFLSGSTGFLQPRNDRVFADLPLADTDTVPTALTTDPDGDIFVSRRTGASSSRGSSTIYRVPRQGGTATAFLTGHSTVADMAFDREGTLYVVEIAGAGGDPGTGEGRLLRKPKDGPVEVVLDGLVHPTGIAVGRGGVVYLSNHGDHPNRGEILRVRPEPTSAGPVRNALNWVP